MTDTVDIPSNELEHDATPDAALDATPEATSDATSEETDAVADATGAETVEAQAEAPVEAPVRVIPDRADAPVSEVTERFLRAVVANVPLELIEELHLFSPLRQGTVETGIAVLAARVPAPAVLLAEPELALDDETVVEAQADGVVASESSDSHAEDAEEQPFAEGAEEQPFAEEPLAVAAEELLLAENAEIAEGSPLAGPDENIAEEIAEMVLVAEAVAAEEDTASGDAIIAEVIADESGDDELTIVTASEVVHAESIVDEEASDDEIVAVIEEVVPPAPVERHTVYTARYRYVIKGPERGKWEANVKAEADAPLVTVETVVRGVQRRAGEDSEIVRFTQAQIAKALRVVLS